MKSKDDWRELPQFCNSEVFQPKKISKFSQRDPQLYQKTPEFEDYIKLYRSVIAVLSHEEMKRYLVYLDNKISTKEYEKKMEKLNEGLNSCVKITGLGPVFHKAVHEMNRDYKFSEWKDFDFEQQVSMDIGGEKRWLTEKYFKKDS